MSSFRFPSAEVEFENLGVSRLRLEAEDGHREYSVTEFCEQLPTAKAIAQSYGLARTQALLARQLKYQDIWQEYESLYWEPRGFAGRFLNFSMNAASKAAAHNYCKGYGNTQKPLPYSISQVLLAQLAYGVSEERVLPPGAPDLAKKVDINAMQFQVYDDRQIYRDANISEMEHKQVLKSGLVTLVGAILPYQPVNPWESVLVLRERAVHISGSETERMLTIPGGHALHSSALAETLTLTKDQLDCGQDGLGHTLVDVTALREEVEETGLRVGDIRAARPLTIADQIMRNSKGEIVRYLGYVWQSLIWDDAIARLQNADGQGQWHAYGPGGEDNDRHSLLSGQKLTPIARIALKNYRE